MRKHKKKSCEPSWNRYSDLQGRQREPSSMSISCQICYATSTIITLYKHADWEDLTMPSDKINLIIVCLSWSFTTPKSYHTRIIYPYCSPFIYNTYHHSYTNPKHRSKPFFNFTLTFSSFLSLKYGLRMLRHIFPQQPHLDRVYFTISQIPSSHLLVIALN